MIAQTTHIETPPEWESTGDWDSHREALYLALTKAKKDDGFIVEMGCGDGSSELMDSYCRTNGLYLRSYETNKEWADKYYGVMWIGDYESLVRVLIKYGKVALIFLDVAPAEKRKKVLELAKDNAKVFVIHDTEPGAEYVYGMASVLSSFKYRIDFKPTGKPHTSIVSNFINVAKWI